MVAQNSPEIAGVLPSSAGYSTTFHRSARFPFFGSAGFEDFNYREMRVVERLMTSPHRVEVFEGGHTWLPVEMATRGVEWMEIQAMKCGLARTTTRSLPISSLTEMARADAQPDGVSRMRELKRIAADFEGLGTSRRCRVRRRARRRQDVAAAMSADQADDTREARVKSEADWLVRQLGSPESADAALAEPAAVVRRSRTSRARTRTLPSAVSRGACWPVCARRGAASRTASIRSGRKTDPTPRAPPPSHERDHARSPLVQRHRTARHEGSTGTETPSHH